MFQSLSWHTEGLRLPSLWKGVWLLLLLAVLSGCNSTPNSRHKAAYERTLLPLEGSDEALVIDTLLPTTPVRDQGRSSLCWLCAMLDVIETNRLAVGDSVRLSSDWLARQYLSFQTRRRFLSRGATPVTSRGMLTTALWLLEDYGAVPEGSYHGRWPVNYHVLCRKLERMAQSAVSLRQLSDHAAKLMDDSVDYLPRRVYMLGAEYTPREFAHSVCLPWEYVALTSFTHHPFGSRFVLETPDNTAADRFLNVPIDTLVAVTRRSLMRGRAVGWEGDISEEGFSYAKGRAMVRRGTSLTQAERQRQFSLRQTTDDHCMALVGLAHDRLGRRYFIAKGTWGRLGGTMNGYMLISEAYFRLKTVCIAVRRLEI